LSPGPYLRLNQSELVECKNELGNFEADEEKAVLIITTSWKKEGLGEGLAFLAELRVGVDLTRLERIAAELESNDFAKLRNIAFDQPPLTAGLLKRASQ
jgi:hypothetical protein